jgi:hypothetical protein
MFKLPTMLTAALPPASTAAFCGERTNILPLACSGCVWYSGRITNCEGVGREEIRLYYSV